MANYEKQKSFLQGCVSCAPVKIRTGFREADEAKACLCKCQKSLAYRVPISRGSEYRVFQKIPVPNPLNFNEKIGTRLQENLKRLFELSKNHGGP